MLEDEIHILCHVCMVEYSADIKKSGFLRIFKDLAMNRMLIYTGVFSCVFCQALLLLLS